MGQVFSTPSVSTTSGHTVTSSVSGQAMSCSPRLKLPLLPSGRNNPKARDGVGGMMSFRS
jgi:hypothetical protein